jgi:hypothetical protein
LHEHDHKQDKLPTFLAAPNLSSTFAPDSRKANRIRYQRVEDAFLGFIAALDWKSVAGASESDEEKAAQAQLEIVLANLDRTARRIAAKTAAMDDPDLDVAAMRVLAAQIAKDGARVTDLEAEKEALAVTIASARARCDALHSPEGLLGLIAAGDNDTRLRLRAEIRKRIARLDFDFSQGGPIVYIWFINGANRLI